MKATTLIRMEPGKEPVYKYIGYTQMLDKITSLMDKVSYENKFILIDKYIEILKCIVKEGEEND